MCEVVVVEQVEVQFGRGVLGGAHLGCGKIAHQVGVGVARDGRAVYPAGHALRSIGAEVFARLHHQSEVLAFASTGVDVVYTHQATAGGWIQHLPSAVGVGFHLVGVGAFDVGLGVGDGVDAPGVGQAVPFAFQSVAHVGQSHLRVFVVDDDAHRVYLVVVSGACGRQYEFRFGYGEVVQHVGTVGGVEQRDALVFFQSCGVTVGLDDGVAAAYTLAD